VAQTCTNIRASAANRYMTPTRSCLKGSRRAFRRCRRRASFLSPPTGPSPHVRRVVDPHPQSRWKRHAQRTMCAYVCTSIWRRGGALSTGPLTISRQAKSEPWMRRTPMAQFATREAKAAVSAIEVDQNLQMLAARVEEGIKACRNRLVERNGFRHNLASWNLARGDQSHDAGP
jgi:hypothetical protein